MVLYHVYIFQLSILEYTHLSVANNIHDIYESASEPCNKGKYGNYKIDQTAGRHTGG